MNLLNVQNVVNMNYCNNNNNNEQLLHLLEKKCNSMRDIFYANNFRNVS